MHPLKLFNRLLRISPASTRKKTTAVQQMNVIHSPGVQLPDVLTSSNDTVGVSSAGELFLMFSTKNLQ